MPTEAQTFPIYDRWAQAFRLLGHSGMERNGVVNGGILHGRIAHLVEDRAGWKAMVADGHYDEVYDPDGQIYYVSNELVGRLPRTWTVVDGESRRIVPFAPLRRPCGPLDPGSEGAICRLPWCGEVAHEVVYGIEVCSSHANKLTSAASGL